MTVPWGRSGGAWDARKAWASSSTKLDETQGLFNPNPEHGTANSCLDPLLGGLLETGKNEQIARLPHAVGFQDPWSWRREKVVESRPHEPSAASRQTALKVDTLPRHSINKTATSPRQNQEQTFASRQSFPAGMEEVHGKGLLELELEFGVPSSNQAAPKSEAPNGQPGA